MKSVYCAVRTGSLNKAVCASSLKRLKEDDMRARARAHTHTHTHTHKQVLIVNHLKQEFFTLSVHKK